MFVKLTHRGKPTIFNTNLIISFHMDTDLKSSEYKCKINTTSGVVFVDEDLIQVHKLLNEALGCEANVNYDYFVPTIDDRMDSSYNKEQHNIQSMEFQRSDFGRGRQYPPQRNNSPFRNDRNYRY